MSSPNRNTIIQTTFVHVSNLIRNSSPIDDTGTKIHIPDSVRLKLYGYYKVATTSHTASSSNASRPSMFDVVGRAKYDAWQSCSQECEDAYEAMRKYVEVAAGQDGSSLVGTECGRMHLEMLEKLEGVNVEDVGGVDNMDDEMNGRDASQLSETETSKMHVISAYLNSFLPTPLVPRGQLDISILDLMYAIFQCIQHATYYMCFSGPIYNIAYRIMPSFINTCISLIFGRFHPAQRGRWFESEIVKRVQTRFNEADSQVVVGLSVRSLLDLYLSVRSFPIGSEVIIVPGISIQGMLDVIEYHHLNLVPIDLPNDDAAENDSADDNICNPKWGIDIEAVKASISKHTVAILVVHPFGALIAHDDVMKQLKRVASRNSLEMWEDCAQCFTGTSAGSKFADISFLSFGPIKTGTSLGGGLAVLRCAAAIDRVDINKTQNTRMMEYSETMKRIQESLYKHHSNLEFFIRAVKCTILNLLSYSRLGCGAVKRTIEFIGYDYGESVVSALRGFRANNNRDLIKQLRQRPNSALLALMYRRLIYSGATMQSAAARKRRCRSFENHLVEKDNVDHLIPRHLDGSAMNGWIFPVLVKNPQHTREVLLKSGIDAPSGLTQLKPVSKSCCPRICAVFDHILYLPVTSANFGLSDQNRLITILEKEFAERKTLEKGRQHHVILLLAILFQWYFVDWQYLSMKLILGITLGLARQISFMASCGMVMLVLLRWYMGQIYLKSSNTFAKYSGMIFKSPVDSKTTKKIDANFQQSQTVLKLDSTEIQPTKFNKDVCPMCLVTGATGFIGSLLLRGLLLHRKSLGIDCVVVIVRAKRGKSAQERTNKLLQQRMFDCLSQDEKSSLVHVIEGDVTVKGCGLTEQQLASLCNMNISHVFHCAAAVSFQQPLEQAAVSNITSSLQIQKLTKSICNDATFVYISTAFVHGGITGTKSNPLPETLFSIDPYDPLELYKSMLGSQSYASAALNELGFPNTYTFSKCICEHLLHADQDVKTVIVRPSIVGPSVQEPYEGWAGEKPSTIVAAACLYLKFPYNMWCFGKELVPFVPADVVCNFVITKAFQKTNKHREEDTAKFTEEKKEVSDGDSFREGGLQTTISTVAWDASSSTKSTFSWVSYAFAITHLGSVCGHIDRVVAYAGLLLSTKIFPWFNFQYNTFQRLHGLLVRAPFDALLYLSTIINAKSNATHNLNTLSPVLDLPMLFFPFANQNFYFKSDLVAPPDFNGERYAMVCAVAAHHFIERIEKKRSNRYNTRKNLLTYSKNNAVTLLVAGSNHHKPASDFLWALTQPSGNLIIRAGGWILAKIFRQTAEQIEVDASCFVELARTLSEYSLDSRPNVIIAPTHRSFYDFLVISYICFSYPELGIDIPFIAAADDFLKIPIIGRLIGGAQAFFIKRHGKRIDPDLRRDLQCITNATETTAYIEVFIEGKRSRYRTFSAPKTGFLRCLTETSNNYLILPVTINYEALPDQLSLMQHAIHGNNNTMSLKSLMHWLYQVCLGNINIGRVQVSMSGVLNISDSVTVSSLCQEIQCRQQSRIMVTEYHIKAASLCLSVPEKMIQDALTQLHVNISPAYGASRKTVPPPQSLDLQWAAMLHFSHVFAPFLASSRPMWASWLAPSNSNVRQPTRSNKAVNTIVERLAEHFDAAESAIEDVVHNLWGKGFANPDDKHIIQFLPKDVKIPLFLMCVAVQMRSRSGNHDTQRFLINKSKQCILSDSLSSEPLFNPSSSSNLDYESLGAWGYVDSYFVLNVRPDGSKEVEMKGSRYSISGKKLPKLANFVEDQLCTKINPNYPTFPAATQLRLARRSALAELDEVSSIFGNGMNQLSIKPHDIARHGTGHTQEDMYGLRSGSLEFRLPDLVVWPQTTEEIKALVSAATARNWCLIPFGGGTNVTHATHCPSKSVDPRPMISVDMKSMNKVIWVNKEDGLAHVEAGITGRQLIEHMERLGLTMGHEPDSYEFSTLGGWIATKASGMKQNKYGNIEDIVKEVTVVGANGIISNVHSAEKTSFGRVSTGFDFKAIVLGSEGCMGIIVSAVIKVWPIAESSSYESVLLPDFDAGIRFIKAISEMRAMKPASVRLLDNDQFRLGQALKPEASLFEHMKNTASRHIGFLNDKLSEKSVVCVTITFEGSHIEVQMQKKLVRDAAASHSGILAGESIGKAGYDLTFAIAYLRDFALNYNILGESFETFAPWSKLKCVIEKTRQRIKFEHKERALPGAPFVCCRVTQLYDEGACVYFYFCMDIRRVTDPCKAFASIEECARQEILDAGGSLSHHHGLGKLRAPFVNQIYSNEYMESIIAIKKSLDPKNIFGARNGMLFEIDK